MRQIVLFFICVVFFSACISRQEKIPRLPQSARILAFGDSLTYGVGASPAESYPVQLEKITGLRVINAGVSGETTTQGAQRIEIELRRYNPQLVVLMEGGNDILRNESEVVIRENLKKMIKSCRDRGAHVVLVAVPKIGFGFGFELKRHDLYEEVAKEMKVPLEEKTLTKLISTEKMKSDDVHLNAQGYLKLAEAVAELLDDTGAI